MAPSDWHYSDLKRHQLDPLENWLFHPSRVVTWNTSTAEMRSKVNERLQVGVLAHPALLIHIISTRIDFRIGLKLPPHQKKLETRVKFIWASMLPDPEDDCPHQSCIV